MPRASLLCLLVLASSVQAGGGPESTLLVVNGRSPASRRIANEYRKLRSIPARNLLVLDRVPHDGVIDLAPFQELIWKPVAARLDGTIDLIAYSADFPYAVSFRKQLGKQRTQFNGGQASLTGFSYLYRQVEAGEPVWDVVTGQRRVRESNRYFRLGSPNNKPLSGEQRNLAMKANRLHREGKLAEARDAYAAFVAVAPGYGRVWVAYASCLAALGDADGAFRALDQAAARGFRQVNMVESDKAFRALEEDERWEPTLARIKTALAGLRETRGFRAAKAWNAAGEPVDDENSLHRYVLAVQLGYTGFRGNSVPEVVEYLRRSAGADGTKPDGTVYICRNNNVRSTAREQFFPALESALRARGRKVLLMPNTLIPKKCDDVIGAVVGTASFQWGPSGSRILPGAILEHLTSFGAHFGTAGQTKLTEFLRFGAAGSSGTVMEPLAIHLKFPNPLIHAFYADGCNLAEAFYQSVHGPYQLMVAGDGLCQPFATPPTFEVTAPAQPWTGRVTIEPKGEAEFEYWLDGARVGVGPSFELDVPDGEHDFRVVAVARDPIATQARKQFEIGGRARPPMRVVYGEPIRFETKGKVEVRYGSRVVATSGEVPSESVGPGPVRLIVLEDGRRSVLDVEVTEPPQARGHKEKVATVLGLAGTINDKEEVVVSSIGPRMTGPRLADRFKGRKDIQRLLLRGKFEALRPGLYQFNLLGRGAVEIKINGSSLGPSAPLRPQLYRTASLASGWHEIEIDYRPKGAVDLDLLLTGAQPGNRPRMGRVAPDVPAPSVNQARRGYYELSWGKRPKKAIGGLLLLPGKDAELKTGWKLDYRTTKGTRWKPVKNLRVLTIPSSRRPPKGKKAVPQAMELVFDEVKARYFLLTPAEPQKLGGVQVSR
ncbi:MAG: hypothetical protein AAGD14_05525 [Planctomycetota bacterium]